jgi:hypothetical protein
MDNSYLIVLGIVILISLIIYSSYKLNNYSVIYYSFVILIWAYYIYLIYIYNSSDPNRPDVVSESFSNTFNNLYEFTVPTIFKETVVSENEYSTKAELINNAYKLGFKLELGLPSQKWISDSNLKLQNVGVDSYYTELYKSNLNRIKSYSKSGIVIHDTDTMGENIYLYNSFDLIESIRDNHLYIYSRQNWDWLLKHRICLWTREPLPKIILKSIENRKKISEYLPTEPFIYPISENLESEFAISSVSNKNSKFVESIDSHKISLRKYSQSEKIVRSI